MPHSFRKDEQGRWTVQCDLRGPALLHHGILNKGTAFSRQERRTFKLEGLLPHHVSTMSEQVERAYAHVQEQADPLDKYVVLASLHERNETVFYRLLSEHIEELMPVVYTPTVGQAVQEYSRIFRRSRGVWITPEDRGRVHEVLANAPTDDVRLIVVTDNERILGLGDQGAGGMGIPIGKLALYTVGAGIHPAYCLPVSLDVGTDNQALRDDPLYIGWRQPRLRGPEYHAFVDEFVDAVSQRWPKALLQWEDFKKQNAFDLLQRHRERILSFNDDIEGTAAVALSGIIAATRVSGIPMKEQRVVILGAGAAGVGIARLVQDALSRAGLDKEEVTRRVALLDSKGLLTADRHFDDVYKRGLAWPAGMAEGMGLSASSGPQAVIEAMAPTVLIGTTGRPGTFTEPLIRAMGERTARPAIFPFSNPTSMSEAHPKDLLAWTEGRAVVASGSPFGTVQHGERSVRIGQGNNVYIFPGIGLGALVAKAQWIVPSMFTVAAQTLAEQVQQQDLDEGSLFPRLSALRQVTERIAVAVAQEAIDQGFAPALPDVEAAVQASVWWPDYPLLQP